MSPPQSAITSADPIKLQTPPIKIAYDFGESRVLAMLAFNTPIGDYSGQTEYWFAAAGLRPTGDLRVTLEAMSGGETEASLRDWIGPLSPAFQCPRVVTKSSWTQGIAPVAAGLTPYFYWMEHPDDAREILGHLLLVDGSGALVSAAWYRSSPPGEDGLAFASKSWRDPFTLLVDARGEPSADPNLLRSTDWYHIMMPFR